MPIMLSVVMLTVLHAEWHNYVYYAGVIMLTVLHAEWHNYVRYAESCYDECHCTHCHYAECQ